MLADKDVTSPAEMRGTEMTAPTVACSSRRGVLVRDSATPRWYDCQPEHC
jgi:hypothetical protein